MKKLIGIVSSKFEVKDIYLSIVEENRIAYSLYKSMGFEYINERIEMENSYLSTVSRIMRLLKLI